MAWLYLFIAGVMEVVWAISLKYTEGWSRLIPSIVTISGMTIGFIFLSLALKYLPISTSYAIWTGIGTVGTAIFGFIILKEEFSILKLIFILFIVVGILGLKLTYNLK